MSGENKTPEAPKVGDGATFQIYTDVLACTVVHVSKSGKQVTLQEDHAELLNGFGSGEPDALQFTPGGFCGHTSGTQRYRFSPNPEGRLIKVSLRTVKVRFWNTESRQFSYETRTVWKQCGHRTKSPGCIARFNGRYKYHDYNF